MSISLGAGKKEEAHKSIGSAVVLCVILSLIVTAIYLIFANGILTAFGGRVNEETFQQAQSYFFWITVGLPFYMFGQAMNPIIRSDGSPRFAMVSTLAGAVVNIILDPIFIFVFKWGMMGAALATILGQILTAALAIWYLCHMKAVKLQKDSFGLHLNLAKQYLALGMTSFLSQISLVAAMAAINNMIRKYGDNVSICIDIVGANVAVQGWTKVTSTTVDDLVQALIEDGASTIVCTDIARDGAMNGTNLELYRKLVKNYKGYVDIMACGGISNMEDLHALADMGIDGAVIGRAFYNGALNVKEVIETFAE